MVAAMSDPATIRRRAAALIQDGSAAAAVAELTAALAHDPSALYILLDLGNAQLAADQPAAALASFAQILASRPRDAAAHRGRGQAHLALADTISALDAFRAALAVLPYDTYAAHMVAALGGEATRWAGTYVAGLFDEHADQFDQHLTEVLHYRIPQAIRDLLAPRLPLASALDLGCGTGLVGAALAGAVTIIDGIDIASQMTRKAAARNIYRHLRIGDLAAVLAQDPALAGPYDLVMAADVFVYLGPLETVFALARQRLSPGGLFAFSVEHAPGDEPLLRPSGRFAHPDRYIARLAVDHGFTVAERHHTPIRHERSLPIPGTLYLLSRA